MDDLVLTLALRWLAAEDAFSASCVSSQWQEMLSGDQDNGDLWKQVCRNSNAPMTSHLQSDDDMNHRLFALGLWGGRQPRVQASAALTYTPTLALDDLFAVLELHQTQRIEGGHKKRKKVLASWACPISCPSFINEDFSGNDDQKVTLKGPNPYSVAMRDSEEVREWQESGNDFHELTPQAFAVHSLIGKVGSSVYDRLDRVIRLDTTLFRRDNMKSVRILQDAQPDGWDPSYIVEALYWESEILKFAPNTEGRTARSMMYDGGYSDLRVGFGLLGLASKLPAPGSDLEPAWLVNCRRTFGNHAVYHPDESDQTALSKIPHFEFAVKSVLIDLHRHNLAERNEYEEFENENEMLVALEGLCWE